MVAKHGKSLGWLKKKKAELVGALGLGHQNTGFDLGNCKEDGSGG